MTKCCSEISENHEFYVFGAMFGTLSIWNKKAGLLYSADSPISKFDYFEAQKKDYLIAVVISVEDNCCFTASDGNVIKIWRLDTGKQVYSFEGIKGNFSLLFV